LLISTIQHLPRSHICNDRCTFKTLVTASASKEVATIGREVNTPAGIGTVIWSWKDYKNETHTHRIENVHFFPTSPVNILGSNAFGSHLNDKNTTGIDAKWRKSCFYWKGGNERTIYYPASQLPDMSLVPNNLTHAFCTYIKRCKSVTDNAVHFCNSSCYSASDEITMVTAPPTSADMDISPFKVGEKLLYTNEGRIQLWYPFGK